MKKVTVILLVLAASCGRKDKVTITPKQPTYCWTCYQYAIYKDSNNIVRREDQSMHIDTCDFTQSQIEVYAHPEKYIATGRVVVDGTEMTLSQYSKVECKKK